MTAIEWIVSQFKSDMALVDAFAGRAFLLVGQAGASLPYVVLNTITADEELDTENNVDERMLVQISVFGTDAVTVDRLRKLTESHFRKASVHGGFYSMTVTGKGMLEEPEKEKGLKVYHGYTEFAVDDKFKE